MEQGKRQLPALTGLRFFLALWVVVYHQHPPLALTGWPILGNAISSILETGYAAVGVFFILSGFVLAYNYNLTTLRLPRNLGRFSVARFSRIYPAYLIGLLLLIPLGAYRWKIGIEGMGAGSLFLHLTLLQAWVPPAAMTWNFPGWSLSNEAFFYALLPFVGPWLWRRAMGRTAGVLVTTVIFWILSLASALYAMVVPTPALTDNFVNFVRYNPLMRLPEFCLGVITTAVFCRLTSHDVSIWNHGTKLYLPAMVLVLAVLANSPKVPYFLLHNGLLAILYMIMILGLALGGGWIGQFLSTRPLIFLGNASYAMYVLHAPIYTWLKLLYKYGLHQAPEGAGYFVAYVSLVVGLSSVLFRFVEEPLHRWLKKTLSSRMEPRETITVS